MRISFTLLLFAVTLVGLQLVLAGDSPGKSAEPCSDDWYQYVEQELVSGDGQGHGPDLGSDEWKGVVEFRLGIRQQPDLPARDSAQWCELIDQLVGAR